MSQVMKRRKQIWIERQVCELFNVVKNVSHRATRKAPVCFCSVDLCVPACAKASCYIKSFLCVCVRYVLSICVSEFTHEEQIVGLRVQRFKSTVPV